MDIKCERCFDGATCPLKATPEQTHPVDIETLIDGLTNDQIRALASDFALMVTNMTAE